MTKLPLEAEDVVQRWLILTVVQPGQSPVVVVDVPALEARARRQSEAVLARVLAVVEWLSKLAWWIVLIIMTEMIYG